MSVFHKTMVWLDYADDNEYYADEYGEPVPAAAPRTPTRATATATAPAPAESSQLTVIRSRREREEPPAPAPAPAPAPRPSAVTPVAMPATRVHVMEPKGFNDTQEVGDRLKSGQPVIL